MTKNEIIERAISGFKAIDENASKLTTGNIAHHRGSIMALAKIHIKLFEKYKDNEI